MIELEGKTAIVTGASSGIGKATAHRLAEEGTSVVLASRSQEELNEISENIKEKHEVDALPVATDVTSESEVENLFQETEEEFGEIDIVVSNAGLAMTGDIEDMPTEHYEKTMMSTSTECSTSHEKPSHM